MNQGTELKRGDRRRGEVRERGRGSVFGQAGQRKGVCRPPDSDGIRDIRSADVRTSERMLVVGVVPFARGTYYTCPITY